jgi:hypothetical protein
MKVFISNVCRLLVDDVKEIEESVKLVPGKNLIPPEVWPFRQIRITNPGWAVGTVACLKMHRGSLVSTLSRAVATELVRDKVAEIMPQWLLCYTGADYKADPDVMKDVEEAARCNNLLDDDIVAVAMVGENRSTLAVCRNIVSGCQNPDTLVADAKGAMEASNVFLVED